MESMEIPGRVKHILGLVVAAWSLVERLPQAVLALFLLMLLDIASGMIAAGVQGRLSSEVSFKGMARKGSILILVGMGAVLDRYLPLDVPVSLMTAVALFYCVHEGLSILENAVEVGLPVPDILRKTLARAGEVGDGEVQPESREVRR